MLLAGLSACASEAERPLELRVFAAASLGECFQALEQGFEAEHPGVDVVVNLAGSQLLAAQLIEGADAQLFASADLHQLARVANARPLADQRSFASNSLVVVLPRDSELRELAQLSQPGLRVVLAGESVPAGRYAREALETLGLREGVEANLVSNEASVRAVVAKVALGEADAGIAYATDARSAPAGTLRTLPLSFAAAQRGPHISYQLARVVNDAPEQRERQQLATAFADYVDGSDAQALLASHGFLPAP